MIPKDINPFKSIAEIKERIRQVEDTVMQLWNFVKYEPTHYVNEVKNELMDIKSDIENIKKTIDLDIHSCNFE
jgi:hypothetical protein